MKKRFLFAALLTSMAVMLTGCGDSDKYTTIDASIESKLTKLADSIKAKMESESIDPADVVGVGIGVPGPVTPNGIVKGCVNLGWGDVPVEETLKDKTGFNVN